ncbi:hypothetical protein NQZ68_026622 [Dissostichus eleginoides]|nr:hypothetical protein NQZ68_026622 [Dissostichus eleginoides]
MLWWDWMTSSHSLEPKTIRERSDGFTLPLPILKSDPHERNRHICMDCSPKANQGTNTPPIFPPDEAGSHLER